MEAIMNIIKALKGFFINLFSGKATGPGSHPSGSKTERESAGAGGLETRCSNPDYGCRYEVS
jgi:hypothetical protein